MKFIKEIPQTEEVKIKKQNALKRRRTAFSVLCFIGAIAGILLLIGMLITLFMAELGNYGNDTKTLLYILTGSFGGAAVVLAVLAVGLSRLAQDALLVESDFIGQCDGENSFFVGEGTLATFESGAVRLHNGESGKTVHVPYEQIRLFSVCTRTSPREKGEWSVLLEIPTKFISKDGKDTGEKALVQTDAKERLYDCLKREGLTLLGETREAQPQTKKFTPVQKYVRPDRKKRTQALVVLIAGIALLVAGIPVAIWLNITVGSIACVLGAFLFGRALFSYTSARGLMVLYREGLWWSDHKNRSASVFLKWDEIERVNAERVGETEILVVHCIYGDYHFPMFAGIEERIASLKEGPKEQ